MSYKLNLHPTVSKAEIALFTELSRQGLTRGMVTQQTIVLKAAKPDFVWLSQRKVVYLDGAQAHSGRQADKDEDVDEWLERRGWQVLRLRYVPPLSRSQLGVFVDKIREFIGEGDI